MRPLDLDKQLGWRDIDGGDVDAILAGHFDLSRYESGDRSVDFFRGGEHVLTLRFRSSDLTLTTMEPRPELGADDVERLAARFAKAREIASVEVKFIDIWRIENGLLVESSVRMDLHGLMQQVGAVSS